MPTSRSGEMGWRSSRARCAAVALTTLGLAAGCSGRDAASGCPAERCDAPAFPRIATYRIEPYLDDGAESVLEQSDLVILDAEASVLDPAPLARLRQKNANAPLLAYVTSEELPRDDDEQNHPLASARFERIPPLFWLTEAGSLLASDVGPEDTEIEVDDASAFRVHPPPSDFYPKAEPTYLLLGAEHLKLVAKHENTLEVERGHRSTPAKHRKGDRVAAHVVFFSGTWMLDIASTAPRDPERGTYRDLLADDVAALVRSGPWSGAFLDVCVDDISWLDGGHLDVDRDGVEDDPKAASRAWSAGMGLLVDEVRNRLGPDAPILANPGAQNCPHPALDGILLEGWPVGLPSSFLSFDTGFQRYGHWSESHSGGLTVANAFSPKIGFGTIGPGADETARTDYRAMRFGLAVSLMQDGYFTFDNGVFGHYVAWDYDEYDGAGRGRGWLGFPLDEHRKLASGALTREFEHGFVVANPSDRALEIAVPEGFVKLAGKQDPAHNDGAAVRGTLSVDPGDGYLLARR